MVVINFMVDQQQKKKIEINKLFDYIPLYYSYSVWMKAVRWKSTIATLKRKPQCLPPPLPVAVVVGENGKKNRPLS